MDVLGGEKRTCLARVRTVSLLGLVDDLVVLRLYQLVRSRSNFVILACYSPLELQNWISKIYLLRKSHPWSG